jgi:hypothetical protein
MAGQVISMTGPALDGWRFLCACLIGLALGFYYGFLRPLRSRHPFFADFLFLPALGYAWLYLGFAICRGDLRLGYCAGLLVGSVFWEMTVGRLLRPVFKGFWDLISRFSHGIFSFFEKNFKKIRKKLKILFAIWKKWFTIVETNHRRKRHQQGGALNGKTE